MKSAASLLTILALSVAPGLAGVCDLLCPTGVEIEADRGDHDAHVSTSSEPLTSHHGMDPQGAADAPCQAVVADYGDGCCNELSVAPPFAPRSRSRSERGPVLTDVFAVLVGPTVDARTSHAEEPAHRPSISPPSPVRAPLVLRI